MYRLSIAALIITFGLSACVTAPTSDMTAEQAQAFVDAQRIETACLSTGLAFRLAKASRPDMSDENRARADAAVDAIEGICNGSMKGFTTNDIIRAINQYLDDLEVARTGNAS